MLPSIMVVTLKSLILSEKSLQVELDYSVIINHIQKHENKFCLHICDHLKWEKRGWGCELGELCICITFSLNKRVENDLFRAARRWVGPCAPFIFHSNYIQSILFYLLFFSEAESLIWQVMLILAINSCQQIPAVIPCAVWLAECKWCFTMLHRTQSKFICFITQATGRNFCFATCRFVESSQTHNSVFVQQNWSLCPFGVIPLLPCFHAFSSDTVSLNDTESHPTFTLYDTRLSCIMWGGHSFTVPITIYTAMNKCYKCYIYIYSFIQNEDVAGVFTCCTLFNYLTLCST